MSLPLTRRIAKTVLLTAAGAASVVGTAGAANAAELPTTADVGGLSTLDQGVATATEGAKALAPKSSSAPTAPAAETAPAAPATSAVPETDFTFESSAPQAGVSVDSNNAGLAHEVGEVSASLTQGQMPQLPDARNAMPEVHTKGLPTDTAPQGQPAPADPKQQSPQQDPAQQDPAQQPSQPAENLMDPKTQAPLEGLAGTSGIGKALTNGLGTLNLA